ncbi:amidase [Pseudonocardia eucalypti]|uniref:Amidase n=1 Tax=Pseudonocardia eucalypti TaxID=648755 RepID=A0ABP9Q7J5_9PSEU|nr:amidase [Pseudonocardia eucalypti]
MTDICALTANQLVAHLNARELSSREITAAHLDRIEKVNPAVNAIVSPRAEQALAEADLSDRQRAAGKAVGPLHGLPMAFKDTHETEGIRTTYGSPLLSDYVPARDELVVARMRAAGVIPLGKTNVPEFAAGSHTMNPVFGLTRNPYDPTRSAGGSSGGAAAALACGMHPLADGSDMGGSLRNPASFCNVVGFRPTPGRVPTWPARLGWATMAVQGPMGRTVADAALLLSVIAGPDDRAPLSLDQPGSLFTGSLDSDPSMLRVAWSPDFGGTLPVEPEVAAVVADAARTFTGLGAEVVRDCPDLADADQVFRTLRAWQFQHTFGEHYANARDQLKPTLVRNIEQGMRLTGPELARAEELHTGLYHRVREFFDRYDVLLLPVSQVAPFPAELEYPTEVAGTEMADYLDWMRSAYYISATGCPALSVPAGFTPGGLPVGVQIVGPARADLAVLRAGHAFEAATGHASRRPPVIAG